MSVFRRGTILYFCRGILRLSGMLAEEYSYTLLENLMNSDGDRKNFAEDDLSVVIC